MEDIKQILKDIVQVEQIGPDRYTVHLPIIYNGGDWTAVEVTKNKDSFYISDRGLSIDNTMSIVNNFDRYNAKKICSRIAKEYGLKVSNDGILYINQIPLDQLYAAITDLAHASQKLSNSLIDKILEQEITTMHALVEDKLKLIFKEHYQEKVVKGYEILGKSSKQYSIPFCINNSLKKILIEPTINRSQSIAMIHTKFFDIGKSDSHIREVVVDDLSHWDTPNLELLKPISEHIIPYTKIAA